MPRSEDRIAWAAHSTSELAELAPRATLVLPVGAIEQHGPHLPAAVDAMVAEHLARRSAEQATTPERPVLVAPTLSFGSSHHHLPLAGTLSLTSTTLHAVLMDLLGSAVTSGFRRFLVLNGHGGNDDVVRQVARDLTTGNDVVAAAAGYWSLARERVAAIAGQYSLSLVPGHAGAFETSLMLAQWPELVAAALPRRVDIDEAAGRALNDVVIERHAWVQRLHGGFTDSPADADAVAGREIMDVLIEACADLLRTLSATEVKHA